MKFIAILITVLAVITIVNSQACSYTNTKNDLINLSNLTSYDTNAYNVTSTKTKNIFYYNICGAVRYCADNAQSKGTYSACGYMSKVDKVYAFGVPNMINITSLGDGNEYGATVVYNSSSACANLKRSTVLKLYCYEGTTVESLSVDDSNNCGVVIEANIPCPGVKIPVKKSGLSGGWIFIIILFSSFAAYAIFGSIINWKVRHQSGSSIFPNSSFWSNFGSLIKDGVFFIKGKVSGTPYVGGGATYTEI
ncbi:hypothetical protein CYY_006839 [Polysphondylium violaceum]|uniref:Autophagy-related protein 27 n=1 Tax=Polysphondylium violaceum TaxID=133409 RepID=A0A8J4PPS5_9MYCE|nr:hypothetical protein CYY_006839 [Polysphondylium violaceum]